MGWWKIDAQTGQPLTGGESQLSTADVTLLNAVPGTDDAPDASYLGDVSFDFSSDLAGQLLGVIKEQSLSAAELRELMLLSIAPAAWSDAVATEAFAAIDAFWKDLDSVYDEDWSRPANEAERRWTCEYVVTNLERLQKPPVVTIAKPKKPAVAPVAKFPAGTRVWAWWNAPQDDYYVGTVLEPGWIARDAAGKLLEEVFYIVRFDDGDEMDVPPERIFALQLPAGLRVEARTPGENRYLPGQVLSASAEAVMLRMADGREMNVPLAALRIEGWLLPK